MTSDKYDRLAGRLEQRLTTGPKRGMAATARDDALDPSAPISSPPVWGELRPNDGRRTTRTDVGGGHSAASTRRRGHLVPDDLHRAARRRMLLGSVTGRTTWTDVVVTGLGELVDRSDVFELVARQRVPDGRKRLVQATLPPDLELRLTSLYLDLADVPGTKVTYERIWSAAIELWLDR